MTFHSLLGRITYTISKPLVFKSIHQSVMYSITASNLVIDNVNSDTIYALSSGPMIKCGVAVIRMSGPKAKQCLQNLLKSPNTNNLTLTELNLEPRRATLRKLYCPQTKELIDQALILYFPSPRSFTGEDVIEYQVHGSRAVILSLFSAFEYIDKQLHQIRPAERGEFTRRAFENDCMDLTEVEGLNDLLEADTAMQRVQALKQMGGYMKSIFENWRQELISCLAHTEAVIDFGDDDRESDIDDSAIYALVPRIEKLVSELKRFMEDGRRGEIVREGVKIALVGPPNAGKSSLLNALAKRPLAIVSPIAGTTRDVVEVRMDLGGVSCVICDTAGLRSESTDTIEVEGMKRARQVFRNAQLRLFVRDIADTSISFDLMNSKYLDTLICDSDDAEEVLDDLSNETPSKLLTIVNKSDLRGSDSSIDHKNDIEDLFFISCKTGEGISELENAISREVQKLVSSSTNAEGVLITRERHRRHLKQCIDHLENFLDMTLTMDLAAEELRLAMQELGRVTGRVDVEEILDVLFRDFCIGK